LIPKENIPSKNKPVSVVCCCDRLQQVCWLTFFDVLFLFSSLWWHVRPSTLQWSLGNSNAKTRGSNQWRRLCSTTTYRQLAMKCTSHVYWTLVHERKIGDWRELIEQRAMGKGNGQRQWKIRQLVMGSKSQTNV
jgi:hypothetical protein